MSALRRRRPGEVDDGPTKRQPVPLVHVDQTPEAAENRVRLHLPAEDVPKLLAGRFQIINLWRPIHHPADDYPLTLCDYRSIDFNEDLVATKLKFRTYDGETFGVKHSERHRWKYLRGMRPDELVLIKWYARGEARCLVITLTFRFAASIRFWTVLWPFSHLYVPLSCSRCR